MRPKTAAALVAFAAVLLAGSAISPWLLSYVDFGGGNWTQLANVGQAYGAVSSILSALALAGVSISIVMQARQSQVARVQADKQFRMMMTQLALADPAVSEVWLSGVEWDSETERTQMLVADLILLRWQTAWEVGELSEAGVRQHAEERFRGVPVVGKFWSQVRLHRTHVRHSEPEDRFSKIIDDVYVAVVQSGTPPTEQSAENRRFSYAKAYGDPVGVASGDEIQHPDGRDDESAAT